MNISSPLFPFPWVTHIKQSCILPENFLCSHRFVGHFSFYNNMIIAFYILFLFVLWKVMHSHGSKFTSYPGKVSHFLLQLLPPQISAARCVPLRRWLLHVQIPISNLLFLDKVSYSTLWPHSFHMFYIEWCGSAATLGKCWLAPWLK